MTERQKRLIREEEIYRNEVKQEISEHYNTKRSAWGKTWDNIKDFSNSSFGIFIYSSIVVACISFGYSQYQEYLREEQEVRDLRQEISYRLEFVNDGVQVLLEIPVEKLINAFNGSADFTLFSQNVNKNLPTLIYRLSGITNDQVDDSLYTLTKDLLTHIHNLVDEGKALQRVYMKHWPSKPIIDSSSINDETKKHRNDSLIMVAERSYFQNLLVTIKLWRTKNNNVY